MNPFQTYIFNTYDKLHKVTEEFINSCTLESLAPEHDSRSTETILNAIDKQIIATLKSVLEKALPLDIAFIHVNCLVLYATDEINTLIPNASEEIFMVYYEFFFYFIVYGCCLGSKYRHLMSVPPSYKKKEVFRYFVIEYMAKMNQSHILYKYTNSTRNCIINSLEQNNVIHGIAVLIADFTEFEFEEFFIQIIDRFRVMAIHRNTNAGIQFFRFWRALPFGTGYITYLIPRLLTSPDFIRNDENIIYFANQMIFRSVLLVQETGHFKMIRCIFSGHTTIKPWTDSVGFVELFEDYKRRLNESDEYMMRTFDECIDIDIQLEDEPCLSIFYNGNNEKMMEKVDKTEIALIHKNIDFLFDHFIIKYCMDYNNILNNLLYQLINSVLYFVDKKLFKSNQILMDKLQNIQNTISQKIDYHIFSQRPKYQEALNKLNNFKNQ